MEIRILTPDDAPTYQVLRLRGLAEAPTAFCSSFEEERERPQPVVEERLTETPHSAVFGAFQAGALVAVAGLLRERALKLRHKALVWGVYVAPEARRGGTGRALMERVLAHAFAWPGLDRVTLSVNATNDAARRLYEGVGFVAFALERDYMRVDGVRQDELHMSLDRPRGAAEG